MDRNDSGCGCSKSRKRWRLLRWALLVAGLSLVFYMPYKATTQYESLQDIYGPWFLQGAVVAIAGLFLTLRPSVAPRLPLVLRVAMVASAVLWMRTGLQCTPHLMTLVKTSLGSGLFAWFHMSVQHIFLSLGVMAFGIAPAALAARMATAADDGVAEALPSDAAVS